MKILYIANVRLPTEKAHGIQIMKMCEAFARQGALVELVVPLRFNNIKENPFTYYDVEPLFTITRVPSLDVVKLGPLGFWIQTLSFAKVVFWYALFKKADVIYSRDEVSLWFLSFIKKNIVWEAHTPRYNGLISLVLKRTRTVVISGGLEKFYVDRGANPDTILVAHDGVDVEQFTPIDTTAARKKTGLPQDACIVGYVGKYKTMGKAKGVDELIEAFGEVHARNPQTLLLLVGINEEEKEEIQKKLHKYLSPGAYRIVNHVPQTMVPLYLSSADMLVMNYPNAEHYALYMSPLKLFEYMAAKRPIIATDLPVVREILNEENAFLIPPDSHDALVHVIEEIYQERQKASSRAHRAREDASRYSWEARARNILSFLFPLVP